MVLKKTPSYENIPWPPKDYAYAVNVNLYKNWKGLARIARIKNVWDLIIFNFQTEDPMEVNYFLEKKIGCRRTSADGNNYIFKGASPGIAYIPHNKWMPSSRFKKGSRTSISNDDLINAVASTIDDIYIYLPI